MFDIRALIRTTCMSFSALAAKELSRGIGIRLLLGPVPTLSLSPLFSSSAAISPLYAQ